MDDDVSKVKPFLLNSIARFLESNGFSRTLKKFRSEAHFEEDDVKIPTMDLEELFFKFMGSTDTVTSDATKQDAENKPKYKKKKARNSTEVEVEEFKEEAENSVVDSKSALNPSEDVEKKSKDKKKKASRSSDHEVQKCREDEKNSMNNGKPLLNDRGGLVKDEDKNSNKAVAGKKNNATKKRKRHELKDCETRSINGDTAEESRLNDTDVTEDVQTEKKKMKASKNTEKRGGLETITNKGHDVEIQEVFGHCIGASKSAEKEGDKNSGQKSMKKQNGSAEPTSVKAFQRVKVEEVIFSDERLKDNSYWAKDGAETGYGAKAQEVLGQVRGRDFRHEKTKKKRGSYRGGQIDLQSHSVKFNYSDDE